MDALDFTQIKNNMTLSINIVPQITEAKAAQLKAIEESTENAMTLFSLGQLIVNSFLALGLKYLWNLVNLL